MKSSDNSSISFSIYYAGKLVREVSFDRPIINIGKLSTSNLRLNDINVSRKHSVIERRENGDWRITDLGSTNGTTVNGRRVTQAPLRDADRVLIGNTTLVVHYDRPAGATDGGAPAVKREEIQGLGENSYYADESDDDVGPKVLEVALLWGETVLSIEHFEKPIEVRVGEVKGCRFTIPDEALGVKDHALVVPHNDSFGLNLDNPRFQGDVLVDGSVIPIGELAKLDKLDNGVLHIDQPMRARLRVGDFILLVSYGHMPAKPRVSPLTAIDYTPHIYVALSAIVHLAFLVFLRLMPPEQLMSRADRDERRLKMIELMKVAQQEKEEEKAEEEQEKEEAKKAEEKDKKLEVAKTEVKAPDKKPDDSLLNKLAKKKLKKVEEELSKLTPEERQKRAKELAQAAGAAKVLSEETSLLKSLLDEQDKGLMMDNRRIRALTSAAGEESSALAGAGAIDPFGGTLGTGGDDSFGGSNSVGGSDPSATGGSDGIMSDLGKNSGKRNLDDIRVKERTVTPVAIASTAKVSGRLDRKTVQSIIRRNLSGIKWCYQDALQRNPKLKGKVTLSFTILPTGKVQSPNARNPSITDAALISCIKKKMGRWRFPSPKDGGVVKVSYPLILKTR